jgi:hypothetical protein
VWLYPGQQWNNYYITVALYKVGILTLSFTDLQLEEKEQPSPPFLHEVLNYRPWSYVQRVKPNPDELRSTPFSFEGLDPTKVVRSS